MGNYFPGISIACQRSNKMNYLTNNKGYTLTELMVTVAIIGIVAGIAIPSFTSYLPRLRLNGAARDLISDLRLARSLAVGQNKQHKLVFDVANETYKIQRSPATDIRSVDYKDPGQNYKGIVIGSLKDKNGADISIIEFDYNGTVTADGLNTNLPVVITIQRSDGSETKKINVTKFGRAYAE